ncbi:hypothetical protein LTR09_003489 [Extremus antarcticus]|uniref:Oxidase FUB9 n=1 Tax=Extremus antarcticus TaxID=702011 RepID=A0AAJ0DJY6_9PEZI|nr:hypothetical protein LTR09_003489 [Extremus antarcticus]
MGGNPVPIPTKNPDDRILCIEDLRKSALKKLPREVADFINCGSTDQITIHENTTAYNKYRVRSRVLIDVSKADTSTICFGQRSSFPLGCSPAGIQGLAHPDGELATARACAKKGVPMAISSFANYSIKDIRSAGLGVGPIKHAMQMYTLKNRELEEGIIREAERQGCTAIFLTADSPVLGVRYNEWRNDFRTPDGLGFPIYGWDTEKIRKQTHDDSFTNITDDSHNWARDIPWLRSVTNMEIWIKGVVTAEDTLMAIQLGCDGIIVSNHGGRQLDGVPATIDALPECVAAAQGRIRIHVDGGIRSGTDMFKAIALGAEYCWVGRPIFWGLS